MRMQFREKLDFIYVAPSKSKLQTKDGETSLQKQKTRPNISTFGRLAYPTNSQMRFAREEIEDNTSAMYHVRYTKELEPVLQDPQSWKVRVHLHPKLKVKSHSIRSADLDMRGVMMEVRI